MVRVRLAPAVPVALALGAAALAAVLAPAGVAVGAAPHAAISVSPAAGGPRTTFTVRFRAPDTTGVRGGWRYAYELSASRSGAGTPGGCMAAVSIAIAPARAGTRLAIRVPAARSGPWCPGAYSGRVDETAAAACAKGTACPALVRLVGTIGRLRFSVRTLAGAPAPIFSGLQRADACTPGPQRPGETTPFTLRWQAASDALTPSSQIVYDVYLATRAGGEDFATPTWTTAPGVTSFRTPGLPSHGSFWFVVRARDGAGNEDLDVDPCL